MHADETPAQDDDESSAHQGGTEPGSRGPVRS